jgi:hypothetical protein
VAGVDPTSLATRFSAPITMDLTPTGIATTDERSLRGFGWFENQPAISQRVVNETALLLGEIDQRFPR